MHSAHSPGLSLLFACTCNTMSLSARAGNVMRLSELMSCMQHLQAQVGDGLEAIAQLQHRLVSTSAAQAQSSNTAKTTSGQHPDPSHDSSPTQGLVSHNSWPSQHLDLLVVDAGSGDASVAMSCPPAPFLESRFLGQAKQVLRHGGMLAVNCVSRAAEPYTAAVKALQVGKGKLKLKGNCLMCCQVLVTDFCLRCSRFLPASFCLTCG